MFGATLLAPMASSALAQGGPQPDPLPGNRPPQEPIFPPGPWGACLVGCPRDPVEPWVLETTFFCHSACEALALVDYDCSALDQKRLMYYGPEWQLLEELVDEAYQASPGIDRHAQYVWGVRYIDDIVSTRQDYDPSAEDGPEVVTFHLTDAQFSTVAIVDTAATVLERVSFTAYGVARHQWRADLNGDGAVDGADQGILLGTYGTSIGDAGYLSEADLNLDGVVDGADMGILLGNYQGALAPGVLSSPLVDNHVGFDGYLFAAETQAYLVRLRWYLPPLGRWAQRDAAEYLDGMNLYGFVRSDPVSRLDSTGLQERGIELRQDWDLKRKLESGQGTGVGAPPFVSNAASACSKTGWMPRNRNQCTYGPTVRYAADFTVYDRDPRKGRCDCDPHVIVNLGKGLGPGGACNARFSWPIDCVCRAMPDDRYSACVRGCIRCIFDQSGTAPSLEEHEWCFDQCNPSTGPIGLLAWKELMEKLDRAIHCCAKRQGILLGPGTGQPGGPKNAVGPPRRFNCDGCGFGPTRPIDCTGIRIIEGRR